MKHCSLEVAHKIFCFIIPLISTNASGQAMSGTKIIQIKLNRVKNPNWLEANQLAVLKHEWNLNLGLIENKFS